MCKLDRIGMSLWLVEVILPDLLINLPLQDDEYGIICRQIQTCRLTLYETLKILLIIITLDDLDLRCSDIVSASISHFKHIPAHYFTNNIEKFNFLTDRIAKITVSDNDIIYLLNTLKN